jgi:hypothetical protein
MSRKYTPTLESITVRAKYLIPTGFETVKETLEKTEISESRGWLIYSFGESLECIVTRERSVDKAIKELRVGAPNHFSITVIEHLNGGILVEIQCRPVMWYRICKSNETEFTDNQVQEALIECSSFVKRNMSVFRGKVIEPISVYPIIQRREIKDRLLNLGLKEIVGHLDDSERHITQNNFVESLTCSRTAFEKMIDWQMRKRGLKLTNNFKNNIERMGARGYLDPDTTQLFQSHYQFLSTIGVHERGIPPGIFEAQMGFGITIIILDYFANKLP